MPLFRLIFATLLLAAALPCAAQAVSTTQSPDSVTTPPVKSFACTMTGDHKLTALDEKLCAEAAKGLAVEVEKYIEQRNSACYSIRDYRFAAQPDAAVPKLKDYSTCERASLFQKREVAPPQR